MPKDTEFYNAISDSYSADRYPIVAHSYTQFFFKRRLAFIIDSIKRSIMKTDKNLSVLEIGCADGIVLREIYESFPGHFSHLFGIDTSPKMIESAVKKNNGTKIIFETRDEYSGAMRHDLVIEIGVINYVPSAEHEIRHAYEALKDGGRYMCSVAGNDSLWNRIETADKGYSNFLSYKEYEQMLQKFFVIEKKIPIGFFVPLLWRAPGIARIIQPAIENIFNSFVPNLFHEKVYLLKRK